MRGDRPMNRRYFLSLLAGGAGIVAATPVRRIWQVGAALAPRYALDDPRSELYRLLHDDTLARRLMGDDYMKVGVAMVTVNDGDPTKFDVGGFNLSILTDVPAGSWDDGSYVLQPHEVTYMDVSPNGVLLGVRS